MQFPEINVPGSGQLHARLRTTLGDIVVRLEEQLVPNTVKNFVGLATGSIDWKDPKTGQSMRGQPLYNGVRFHRVIPNFMIQCGDPMSRHTDMAHRWGTGNPGYKFADEFNPKLRHSKAGILSMANSGPASNGAQWFITEGPTPHLDNKHSVFGKVVSGMDVVDKIRAVPTTVRSGMQDVPKDPVVIRSARVLEG